MRPVSSLVRCPCDLLNRGLVEPIGTFGGCANCHSGRVKSHTAYDPHELNCLDYSRSYFPGFQITVGRAADMDLAKLPVANLHAVAARRRIANVFSEPPIEAAVA